jgi:hypothetical protein
MEKNSFSLQLITLADYLITGEDKKLSIIGMFDKFFVKELPSVHKQMWLIMVFTGDINQKEKVHMSVRNPLGEEELSTDIDIAIGENRKATVTINFEGFPVREIGTFTISITKGKKDLGVYTFESFLLKNSDSKNKITN